MATASGGRRYLPFIVVVVVDVAHAHCVGRTIVDGGLLRSCLAPFLHPFKTAGKLVSGVISHCLFVYMSMFVSL